VAGEVVFIVFIILVIVEGEGEEAVLEPDHLDSESVPTVALEPAGGGRIRTSRVPAAESAEPAAALEPAVLESVLAVVLEPVLAVAVLEPVLAVVLEPVLAVADLESEPAVGGAVLESEPDLLESAVVPESEPAAVPAADESESAVDLGSDRSGPQEGNAESCQKHSLSVKPFFHYASKFARMERESKDST
jgi:hypothetical protein